MHCIGDTAIGTMAAYVAIATCLTFVCFFSRDSYCIFFIAACICAQRKVGKRISTFENIFAAIIWIGVALHITDLLPELLAYLENTTIPLGHHHPSLLDMLQAIVSSAMTLIVALWGASSVEQRLMRMDSVHPSLRAVLARIARASLILVAMLLSLSLLGLDLTVLSVFGGALGVGIGLGLQRLVSNYVSGFVILLERSFSIGDLVVIDKYTGRI